MVLVVAVYPHQSDPGLPGRPVQSVQVGILPAGPQPEVAELQYHRAVGVGGRSQASPRPFIVAVPVAGQQHPPGIARAR